MRTWWGKRQRSERGTTAVEYGLLVALIAGVMMGTLHLMGVVVQAQYQRTSCQLSAPAIPPGC